MSLTPAHATVQIDNDVVRVTRWDFKPNTETTAHRHAWDYVVVPVTSGTLTITNSDGSVMEADLVPGASYSRIAGTDHNVVNLTDQVISFVEIELLDRPG
jgi:quercetin dioxygenase-like cupin family protein